MGLFQLIAQVMSLCGFVIAVAFGLLTAPWYVLIVALLVVIAVTQALMPKQEVKISIPPKNYSKSAFDASRSAQPNFPTLTTNDGPQSDLLIYRGVIYSKKSS